MEKRNFAISSLVVAGLIPVPSPADQPIFLPDNKMDELSEIVSSITSQHEYILAGHRSHSSHSSHQSHRSSSSRSYSSPAPRVPSTPVAPSNPGGRRNEMSTPPSSVLPKSHGTLEKGKTLPGNSQKFKKLVLRVQLALDDLGYNVGQINGEVHAMTTAAIYKYQQDKILTRTGTITQELLNSLGIVAK